VLLSIMPTTKWGLTANTVLPSASMLDPYLATKAALALAANGSSRTYPATPSTTTASLAPWVHTGQLGRPTRFLALRVGRPGTEDEPAADPYRPDSGQVGCARGSDRGEPVARRSLESGRGPPPRQQPASLSWLFVTWPWHAFRDRCNRLVHRASMQAGIA